MTDGLFTEAVCAELERVNDELIGELQALGRPDAGLIAIAINEAFLIGDAPRWQPIETAPDRYMQVGHAEYEWPVAAYLSAIHGKWFDLSGQQILKPQPTHWRPMIAMPPEVTP